MNVVISAVLLWIFVAFPIWMIIDCVKSNTRGLTKKIAWIFLIALFPFLGAMIYAIFGSKVKSHRLFAVISLVVICVAWIRLISFGKNFELFRSSDVLNLKQLSSGKLEPIPTTDSDPSNAASIYLKAHELMKYPKEKELVDQIKKIDEDGWADQSGALARILDENTLCLAEINKAIGISKCDYYFGIRQESKFQEVPRYSSLVLLSRLVLLKARNLENQGKQSQAIDFFLIPFGMAIQVSQNKDMVAPAIATAISHAATSSLKNYLDKQTQLNPSDLKKISTSLSTFQAQMFLPRYYIERAKQDSLAIVDLLADSDKEMKWATGKEPKFMELQASIIKQRGAALVDEIYAPFFTAAISDSDADWKLAWQKPEEFREYPRIVLEGLSGVLYSGLKGDEKPYVQSYVDAYLKIAFSVGIPNFRPAITKHHEMLKELDGLINTVNSRLKNQK